MTSIDVQLELPEVKDVRHGKGHHDGALAEQWEGNQVKTGMMRDEDLSHGWLQVDRE